MNEETGMDGLMAWLSNLSGKMPALCQQFQIIIMSTSHQAALAKCIASSWLISYIFCRGDTRIIMIDSSLNVLQVIVSLEAVDDPLICRLDMGGEI